MLRYKSICVYRDAARAVFPLAELACCRDGERAVELAAAVFSAVADSGCDTTGEWIKMLLRRDDNVFSRTAARGGRVSARLKTQVQNELAAFKRLSLVKPDDYANDNTRGFFPSFGFGGMSATYERLALYYAVNGCGAVSTGSAFCYRDGLFVPADTGGAALSDILGYADEKAELVRNVESFIAGLPAFHTLLYGDGGTGKTATVRALAHEYRDKLKLVEISGRDALRIGEIRDGLAGLKQKFLLFIDDIDEGEELASALENVLDAPVGNTLVCCTALRKQASAAGDGRDVSDKLALFDRFGLVVTYILPTREQFTAVLKQMLRSRGIKWHDEYSAIAELAVAEKCGRSPRAAKRIADLIESNYAEKRSEKWAR